MLHVLFPLFPFVPFIKPIIVCYPHLLFFFSLRLQMSEENIAFSDVFVQLRLESLTVNKGRFPWEWCRWKALLALTLKWRGGASFKMSISSKLGSGCKTQVAYFAVLLQSASYCAFFFPSRVSGGTQPDLCLQNSCSFSLKSLHQAWWHPSLPVTSFRNPFDNWKL